MGFFAAYRYYRFTQLGRIKSLRLALRYRRYWS